MEQEGVAMEKRTEQDPSYYCGSGVKMEPQQKWYVRYWQDGQQKTEEFTDSDAAYARFTQLSQTGNITIQIPSVRILEITSCGQCTHYIPFRASDGAVACRMADRALPNAHQAYAHGFEMPEWCPLPLKRGQ